MPKIISSLSKMWLKVTNQENSLFPELKEVLRIEEFSAKESKLIKILDFAEIEKNITVVKITNIPQDRVEIARSFIAKAVYNLQTTRDLIDRLHIDSTLRKLCGWRYKRDIPSESKFSRVFKELSEMKIAEKTHEKFVKEYLSQKTFFYNATDATKIPLRQKVVKKEKVQKVKAKRGRPKKGETREPIKLSKLELQKEMKTVQEMLTAYDAQTGHQTRRTSGHLESNIFCCTILS